MVGTVFLLCASLPPCSSGSKGLAGKTSVSSLTLLLCAVLQVEEEDDFKTLINPNSKFETPAVGDLNMSRLKKGDIIQLERKGYYILDVPAQNGAPAVLFSIPDGRTKASPSNNSNSK